MKKSRFHHNARIPFALASAIAAMLTTHVAHAAAGTWTQTASGGLWSDTANWSGGTVANNAAANFNTIDITANNTVHLDSARTITSLTFGDTATGTAASWILDNNGNAANTLTGLTAITVNALGTGETATISAAIAGSTSRIELNGAGGGTLVLAGANTFNFATNNANFGWRLNVGSTVVIASDSAFGVTTGTDFNATTLVNLNGGAVQASGSARTVANPIWLNGSTTVVSGSQSLTFSGAVMGRGSDPTVTNNITGGGTLSFTGKVYTDQINASKTLTFNGAGNTLISGVIANNTGNVAGQNGSIIKSGAGTLTLSGTNTYTGATNVTAGILVVNGNIASSSLTTVASGATIGGSGTVGVLTVSSGGFINPGNSPGILNTGNYTQAGTYTAEITGLTAGTEHDQIDVTGTVNITGGSLTTAFSAGTYTANDPIFILLNDGADAITGEFVGLVNGATVTTYGGFDWIISYFANSTDGSFTGGNDIALMAAPIPEPNIAALIGGFGVMLILRRRR